jgi:hypothetical protein
MVININVAKFMHVSSHFSSRISSHLYCASNCTFHYASIKIASFIAIKRAAFMSLNYFEVQPLGVTFLQIVKLLFTFNPIMAYIGFNGKVAFVQNLSNLKLNHLKVDFWFKNMF